MNPAQPPTSLSAEASTDAPVLIVARAGRYYRNARYIMVALALGLAGYFAYDGWNGYPEHNRRVQDVTEKLNAATSDDERTRLGNEQRKLGAPHTDKDIQLQKQLAVILPFPSLAYLFFVIRRSRGEIRFDGKTLTAPGHPSLAVGDIKSVDPTQWKKKGIAILQYEVNGRTGAIKLDDFIYEQKPIDSIYEFFAKAHNVWQEPTPTKGLENKVPNA